MKHKKWMITAKRADFNEIARACGISPVLARLIRNRDVIGVEETRRSFYVGDKPSGEITSYGRLVAVR